MAMETKYIVANSGSASRKYAFYEGDHPLLFCHIEHENGGIIATCRVQKKEYVLPISDEDYARSGRFFISLALKEKLISEKNEISAVGFRVVAPGEYFLETKKIDSEYIQKLKDARENVPLHTSEIFFEIEEFSKLLSEAIYIGISDSAFHKNLPHLAKSYAISSDMNEAGIRRYGYHGISLSYISEKMKDIFGSVPERVIVCHLGSGASVTALKNGKCFDTSMGFTPLEGLVMATRSGDIDAGAVIEIAKKKNISLEKVEEYLNTQSGLLGLSGFSSDVRELLKKEAVGDTRAAFALEMFIYRVKKYIGAYSAILGGIDAIIFTAAIGERSPVMRERICNGLDYLGIILDEEKNKSVISKESSIEGALSRVTVAVIPTDETSEMANELRNFLKV